MIWRREPVLIQGALIGVLNLVSALGWLPLTPGQMGAVNTALAGVLALVTRQVVSPVPRARIASGSGAGGPGGPADAARSSAAPSGPDGPAAEPGGERAPGLG